MQSIQVLRAGALNNKSITNMCVCMSLFALQVLAQDCHIWHNTAGNSGAGIHLNPDDQTSLQLKYVHL
jgi:hypothetical protein